MGQLYPIDPFAVTNELQYLLQGNANTWDDRARADGYEVNHTPTVNAVFRLMRVIGVTLPMS